MLTTKLAKELFRHAMDAFVLDKRGIHGPPHWGRVRTNGLRLAQVTGADPTLVELFAMFHDCKREDDGGDPLHGERAAGYIWTVRHLFPTSLTIDDMDTLVYAINLHSDGQTVVPGRTPRLRATIATCWDADRLDLGRVGVMPDPRLLCTDAARDPAILQWAYERSIR